MEGHKHYESEYSIILNNIINFNNQMLNIVKNQDYNI